MNDDNIKSLEYLLREINHRMNLITRSYLNTKGITMSRFWVLNKLYKDKPITMKQLQMQLLLSPGTLTGLIDNLVNDNLVKRWRDNEDRRLVYLTLTEEGYKLLVEILEYRSSVLKKIIDNKNSFDIKQLNDNLESLLKMSDDIIDLK
ncbi:MarR family transcriptional regulator [Thermoanaerobacterium sp. RBIITD]|uniref:MarR family winged helix-turn-helix transcriptional regulator n=1 Tax=Thermoanaerobacterium sp. RBIITD TaxID=1550240 RepID=UPI000BB7D968|nr:MarR family transcriptional regulator [Thermoanaerobacterium sp. RBIITD]SNX55207.1 DNA-binding transcriptional regulator, MarR family [Thermoanaerobacterium sp. RBIITD]